MELYLGFIATVTRVFSTTSWIPCPLPFCPKRMTSSWRCEQASLRWHGPGFEVGAQEVLAVRSLMAQLARGETTPEAAAAISSLLAAPDEELRQRIAEALKDDPSDKIAERVLILSALQVTFARMAAAFKGEVFLPVTDEVCPCMRQPPDDKFGRRLAEFRKCPVLRLLAVRHPMACRTCEMRVLQRYRRHPVPCHRGRARHHKGRGMREMRTLSENTLSGGRSPA